VNNTLETGISLCKKGKYAESIEILKPIAKSESTNVNAHLYLGIAYSHIQKYEEASIEFLTLTHLEPTNPHHYFNLGKVYEDSGDDLQAESAYMKALKIDPDYQKAKDHLTTLKAKPHKVVGAQSVQKVDQPPKPDGTDDVDYGKRQSCKMAIIDFLAMVAVPTLFLGLIYLIHPIIQNIYVHSGDGTKYFLWGAGSPNLTTIIFIFTFLSVLHHYIDGQFQIAYCIATGQKPDIGWPSRFRTFGRTIYIEPFMFFNPVIYNRVMRGIMAVLLVLFLMSLHIYTRVTDSGVYIHSFWSIGEKHYSFAEIKSVDRLSSQTCFVFYDGTEWNPWNDSQNDRVAVDYISQHLNHQNPQYPATSYP